MYRFACVCAVVALTVSVVFGQWTLQESPISTELWCAHAADTNTVWAGGIFGEIIRTTDGGKTEWRRTSEPEYNFRALAIFARDSNTAWVTGVDESTRNRFRIFKTVNGGANWTKVHDQGMLGIGIGFFDDLNGVAVGVPDSNWIILTTADGGDSWQQLPVGNFPAADCKYFVDPDEGGYWTRFESPERGLVIIGHHAWFASAGDTARVYRSRDRGLHWERFTVDTVTDGISIAFMDTLNGAFFGVSGTRGYTRDGGETWTVLDPVEDELYSLTHVPGTATFIAAGDFQVSYISRDTGKTWQRQLMPNNYGDYWLLGTAAADGIAWACGSGGRVLLWRDDAVATVAGNAGPRTLVNPARSANSTAGTLFDIRGKSLGNTAASRTSGVYVDIRAGRKELLVR